MLSLGASEWLLKKYIQNWPKIWRVKLIFTPKPLSLAQNEDSHIFSQNSLYLGWINRRPRFNFLKQWILLKFVNIWLIWGYFWQNSEWRAFSHITPIFTWHEELSQDKISPFFHSFLNLSEQTLPAWDIKVQSFCRQIHLSSLRDRSCFQITWCTFLFKTR